MAEESSSTSSDDDDVRYGIHDLIYDRSRYKEERSPNALYMPKKEMLFDMLRACIGVN